MIVQGEFCVAEWKHCAVRKDRSSQTLDFMIVWVDYRSSCHMILAFRAAVRLPTTLGKLGFEDFPKLGDKEMMGLVVDVLCVFLVRRCY